MSFAGLVPGVLGAIVQDASRLPEHLSDASRVDAWTEAAPGALLFRVPNVARYLVENGRTIRVEAAPGADRNSVELFLHGSARGSLIHQRSELALEATTLLAPSGGAVAISSRSGAGKSTVAAELCRRGWSLIADDITRVTWTGGRALVWPSSDSLKLWKDACDSLGIVTDNLRPAREGMQKFYVKMPAVSAPTVLRAVLRLQIDKEVRLGDISPDMSIAFLSECTFRWAQIPAMKKLADHENIARLVSGGSRLMALMGARECPRDALADQIARVLS